MTDFEFDEPSDFYSYIKSDKSDYATARSKGFIDPDDDFLVNESGRFLMNIDFTFVNTDLLSPAARVYLDEGQYTDEDVDTPPYEKFRLKEEHRRSKGFQMPCKKNKDGSISNLRITGDHYNFLNYGRMLRLDEVKEGGKVGRKKVGFPRFVDAQYWWFKIKEFCTNNGLNEIVCKTRRGGFSYSEAIDTANEINLNADYTVLLAAELKDYLTQGNAIANMAREQIYFYEDNTPFKRGLISRNMEDLKLGYKDKNGNDKGYKSKMICASTFNNPDAAIGKDAVKVKAEEIGKFSNFDEFCTQTMPTLRTGAYITGKLTAFGTINADNTSREVFSYNFYNPDVWSFMGFENVWDKNSRHLSCGYYKPYWWGLEGSYKGQPAMDKDGNTNYNVAIKIVEEEQSTEWANAETLKDYGDYIGQYGNRPEDSFGASFDNIFVSEGLINHINDITKGNTPVFYRDGKYSIVESKGKIQSAFFETNEKLYTSNRHEEIHEYITRLKPSPKVDNHGCWREYNSPLVYKGVIPDDLYRIWVDPYGVDKDDNKEITDDNSYGCIKVYMKATNINGEKGDKLVAQFVGRPPKQEDFDRIILHASYRWNAKVFTENDRGQVVQDFKHWREHSRLVIEPSLAWDTKLQGKDGRGYGISIGQGSDRKLNGILFYKEWLYTVRGKDENEEDIYNYHTITDIGDLNELKSFNSTGNFDRISTMIVGAYDIKEMNYNLRSFIDGKTVAAKTSNNKRSVWKRNWYK